MTQICRFCGAEIQFNEQSTAAICPECGDLVFLDLMQALPSAEEADAPASADGAETEDRSAQSAPVPADARPAPENAQMEVREDYYHLADMVDTFKKKKEKRRRITAAVLLAVIVLGAACGVYAMRILPQYWYDKASAAFESGNYPEAYARFRRLNAYRDARKKRCEANLFLLDDVQVGDQIEFGMYEQDDKTDNGREIIQWYVLAREGDRCLIISRRVLDSVAFHRGQKKTTWADSDIRAWLNDTFLSDAFLPSEQERICSVQLPAEKNPSFDTDPGAETTDRVFLLSVEDVNRFFADSGAIKRASPTMTARKNRVSCNDNKTVAEWWLRTPGEDGKKAVKIDLNGNISMVGSPVNYHVIGVRPAMWIDVHGQ